MRPSEVDLAVKPDPGGDTRRGAVLAVAPRFWPWWARPRMVSIMRARLSPLATAALALVGACASVEGLSSYSTGPCTGGVCDAGLDAVSSGADATADARGGMTPVCTPGQTRCDGNAVVSCEASGVWSAPSSCQGVCVAGACAGSCAPGTTQCSGNGVEGCGPDNQWQAPTACTNQTCVAGVCQGACAPGQTQCLGNLVQSCDAKGQWQTQTTCSGSTPACLNSTCVQCAPGAVQCVSGGAGTQTCTSGGAWGATVDCKNQTCFNGACTGSCAPGQTQCSGNSVQTCGPTGTFQGGTPCAQPTPSCVSGACACSESTCGGTCTPLTTVTNCGACGVKCNATNATGSSCDGTTCSYTCQAGTSDCNKGTPPDGDGCECATPACCGTGCQTKHSNGFGQFFYDCNPPGTFTVASAMAACAAYTGNSAMCSTGGLCNNNALVCANGASSCVCWQYQGSFAGYVSSDLTGTSCYCPGSTSPTWN